MNILRSEKMWVVTVDENGKDLGDGHWVKIPKPVSFASDGFAHIESYVTRLLQSSASYTSVIIGTPDHQTAVLVSQRDGVPEFGLFIDWRSDMERERAIRPFFAERGLSTSHDYLAGNGDVPDATRCLGYFLPTDVEFITTITKNVLQQIYRLREQDALNFTYEEHNKTA
jgi:hypothetical protein